MCCVVVPCILLDCAVVYYITLQSCHNAFLSTNGCKLCLHACMYIYDYLDMVC